MIFLLKLIEKNFLKICFLNVERHLTLLNQTFHFSGYCLVKVIRCERMVNFCTCDLAATHAMELPYLFGKGLMSSFKPTIDDQKVMEKFHTLISNFAIYGSVLYSSVLFLLVEVF